MKAKWVYVVNLGPSDSGRLTADMDRFFTGSRGCAYDAKLAKWFETREEAEAARRAVGGEVELYQVREKKL